VTLFGELLLECRKTRIYLDLFPPDYQSPLFCSMLHIYTEILGGLGVDFIVV
jgi:hypothetical protein